MKESLRESHETQADAPLSTADYFRAVLDTKQFELGCMAFKILAEGTRTGQLVPTGLPSDEDMARLRTNRVLVSDGVTVPSAFAEAYNDAYNTVAITTGSSPMPIARGHATPPNVAA